MPERPWSLRRPRGGGHCVHSWCSPVHTWRQVCASCFSQSAVHLTGFFLEPSGAHERSCSSADEVSLTTCTDTPCPTGEPLALFEGSKRNGHGLFWPRCSTRGADCLLHVWKRLHHEWTPVSEVRSLQSPTTRPSVRSLQSPYNLSQVARWWLHCTAARRSSKRRLLCRTCVQKVWKG